MTIEVKVVHPKNSEKGKTVQQLSTKPAVKTGRNDTACHSPTPQCKHFSAPRPCRKPQIRQSSKISVVAKTDGVVDNSEKRCSEVDPQTRKIPRHVLIPPPGALHLWRIQSDETCGVVCAASIRKNLPHNKWDVYCCMCPDHPLGNHGEHPGHENSAWFDPIGP